MGKRFRRLSGRYQLRLRCAATLLHTPTSFWIGLRPELDPTCNISENCTSFIRPRNATARLFHNAQDFVAAHITMTMLYKEERERWERDKKPFSGKRYTNAWELMDECYRFGPASKGFIRLKRND